MIRLFYIKNKLKNKKLINENDKKSLNNYKEISKMSKQDIIKQFGSNEEHGLSSKQAAQKLVEDGAQHCS